MFASLTIMVIETLPSCQEAVTQESLDRIRWNKLDLKVFLNALNSSFINPRLKARFVYSPPSSLLITDWLLNVLFTVELCLRFVTTPYRKAFIKDPFNIMELIANLSVWIPVLIWQIKPELMFITPTAAKATFIVCTVRVLRVFRLLKMARFVVGLRVMILTIKSSLREIALLVMVMAIAMVIFASFMYYAEYENTNSDFHTIPIGFWWSIITMTTVGYGDMAPKGWAGYVVGVFCAIAGVIVTGLPIPIVSQNFYTYYKYAKRLEAAKGACKKKQSAKKHSAVSPE